MDYIINNYVSFANTYVAVLTEIYLVSVVLLFAYWLKLFVAWNVSH